MTPPSPRIAGPSHGLGAGVAEEGAIAAGVLDEELRQLDLWHRVELVGGLHQDARLFGDGLDDRRMAMAEAGDCPATHHVEVLPVAVVEDAAALAADDRDGSAVGGVHQVTLGQLLPIGHGASFGWREIRALP